MEYLHLAADALLDTLLDTAKLLPLLYLSYLLIETLEHHAGGKAALFVTKAGKAGPLLGALLGLVPQCGFSGAMASLYCAGTVSLGSFLAVLLSTSDEMLPVLLAGGAPWGTVGKLLLCKFGFALTVGFALELLFRGRREEHREEHIHELCEKEHCACEGHSVFYAALVHTVKIALTVFALTFLMTFLLELFGEEALRDVLSVAPVLSAFLAGLVGLIPSCSVSVILTGLYLSGALGGTALLAGLFANGGVGLLVLFRMSGSGKKNAAVTALLYGCSVAGGLLLGWIL